MEGTECETLFAILDASLYDGASANEKEENR